MLLHLSLPELLAFFHALNRPWSSGALYRFIHLSVLHRRLLMCGGVKEKVIAEVGSLLRLMLSRVSV
jgi:hypothetical protein